MSDRGSYRSIYTVLVDSPEYQALPPNAKLVWLTLKITLGPTGIDVFYPGPIEAQTGLSSDQVMVALETLAHADWIRRDGNIVWVINGLRYEPSRSLANANHRKEIAAHLKSLPKRTIVSDFRRYYGFETEAAPATPPTVQPPSAPAPPISEDITQGSEDGITEGMAKGIGNAIGKHGNGNGNGRRSKTHVVPDGTASEADPDFERAWQSYPRRSGSNPRRDALHAWRARLRAGEAPAALLHGLERYRRFVEHEGMLGTVYVMQAKRFFGASRPYAEPWELPEDPVERALMAERRAQDEDQHWLAARGAAQAP